MSIVHEDESYYCKINYSNNNGYIIEKKQKKKCLIAIGKCSRTYLYILYSGLFKLITLVILGDDNIRENGLGLFGFCPILYKYNFIQSIYIYFGYILLGLIFFYSKGADIKGIKNQKEKDNLNGKRSILQKEYIHYKGNKITKNTKTIIFLVCITFVFHIEIKKVLYILGFQFFNFWTLEIVFMLFLMRKFFIIDFYIHHKVSILFNIITCSTLLLIASFLPTSLLEENTGNSYQNTEKKLGNYSYCILLIVFFIFLSFIYSYSRTFSKILMQFKFISPYKLIIFFGITGFIVSSISSIIAIFIDYQDNIKNYYYSIKSVLDDGNYYKFYAEIFLVTPFFII